MSKAKLERLLNLTALLIETERPLTAVDIARRMEAYPDDPVACRQAFERDKRDLRDMGIPLVMEPVPGRVPAVEGYRIPKDHYYLADPGLDRDELAALHLAATVVRLDGAAADEGLAKLGSFAGGAAAAPTGDDLGLDIAALPARPDLGAIFGAVVDCQPVRFTYRGELRTLDPYRLDFQRGRWYLSGFDHRRAAQRIFRLDRIVGQVEVLDGPRFTRPTDEAPGGPVDPWRLGDGDPVMARLLVDPSHAPWLVDYLGPEAVVEHRDDGAVVVELPVTNRDSFRSFALTFLDHAEVLSPAELRDDLVAWLQKLAV
jgi:proteasome accessory factor B